MARIPITKVLACSADRVRSRSLGKRPHPHFLVLPFSSRFTFFNTRVHRLHSKKMVQVYAPHHSRPYLASQDYYRQGCFCFFYRAIKRIILARLLSVSNVHYAYCARQCYRHLQGARVSQHYLPFGFPFDVLKF